jgi:putative DNA primase/helicase
MNANNNTRDTPVHVAALTCASKNLQVFPVKKLAKTPMFNGWQKMASTDKTVIRKWFGSASNTKNSGILTGRAGGVVVIDADVYKPDCEFEAMIRKLGELPDTFTVKTGQGGFHYYFLYPNAYEIGNSTSKIGKKVDVRGNGGYVVGASSIITRDDGGKGAYTIEKNLPFADLPTKWLDRLASTSTLPALGTGELNDILAGSKRFELPEQIPDGERNDTLFRYGGQLAATVTNTSLIAQVLLDTNKSRCDPPLHETEVLKIANRHCKDEDDRSYEWPEPVPFDSRLMQVPSLDINDYPLAFQSWISDCAERMQCPPEYIACSIMVSAAAALGNSIAICPKARDIGWVVSPTLWGAIVGRPGVKKTPALDVGLKHLRTIEEKLLSDYKSTLEDYTKQKAAHDINSRKLNSKSYKNPVNASQIGLEPEKPLRERVVVNDATPEKLVEILVGSPKGVLVQLDEITGLFESFLKKGNEGSRQFYLTGWNGHTSHSVDRIGRGSTTVPRVNICLLGGIQPSKLEKYVREATQGGGNDDGLMQRLQFLVYPDPPTTWELVDRVPDLAANDQVSQAFNALRNIDPYKRGATTSLVGNGIPYLQFDSTAQPLFNQWMEWLERKLRTAGYPPAIESHLGKYRSLVPALAMLDHLVDGGVGAVSKQSLSKAIRLSVFLWKHALRAYGYRGGRNGAAIIIAAKIRENKLHSGFTLRDLNRKEWSQLTDKAANEKALDLLIEKHWLHKEKESTGGKPKTIYRINPRIYEND